MYKLPAKLEQEFKRIKESLFNQDFDIFTEMEQIEALQPIKVVNTSLMLKEIEVALNEIKKQKQELDLAKKNLNLAYSRLTSYILDSMVTNGQKKIKSPYVTVSRKKNPPKVLVLDRDAVPDSFLITTTKVEVDKKKIKETFKQTGLNVEGTEIVHTESIKLT